MRRLRPLAAGVALALVGGRNVAAQTFVANQCKGITASAIIRSPTGMAPLLDLRLRVVFHWERSGRSDEVVVPVQINGKVRARLQMPADLSDDEMRERVLTDAAVTPHTAGKTVRKVVIAKGPLVSVVVS